MRPGLRWDDEIVVDGRRVRVGDVVLRRLAHFAVAAARPFFQAVFVTPLVHDLAYADGTQGRLEFRTELDGAPWRYDAAGLAALADLGRDPPPRTVRRFAVRGADFSASLRQYLSCFLPSGAPPTLEAVRADLSWSEMATQAGDLAALLRFLRVAWS